MNHLRHGPQNAFRVGAQGSGVGINASQALYQVFSLPHGFGVIPEYIQPPHFADISLADTDGFSQGLASQGHIIRASAHGGHVG